VEKDRVFYGVGRLDLHIPHSQSLKDKRAVMKSLKSRLAERARVSVVDAGPQEFWQRGALGVSLVAREESQIRSGLASILRTVEKDDRVVVLSYRTRIGSLDDEPMEGEE
jgi:uncharacterized protein YlxP (DUF503 family)